jgi:uncharacterized protein YggT (Ycf19 family)
LTCFVDKYSERLPLSCRIQMACLAFFSYLNYLCTFCYSILVWLEENNCTIFHEFFYSWCKIYRNMFRHKVRLKYFFYFTNNRRIFVGTASRVSESNTKQDDIEKGWPGVHTMMVWGKAMDYATFFDTSCFGMGTCFRGRDGGSLSYPSFQNLVFSQLVLDK